MVRALDPVAAVVDVLAVRVVVVVVVDAAVLERACAGPAALSKDS